MKYLNSKTGLSSHDSAGPHSDGAETPTMTEVIQGLTDLRDALVHLSLALHDYQFALYAHEDDAAALLKDQILEQARLHEPRLP